MVIELKEPGRPPRRPRQPREGTPGGDMTCPVCGVPLAMAERQGVEIDYCPSCRGVWLDRGELDKIIERAAAEMAPPAPPAGDTLRSAGPDPAYSAPAYPERDRRHGHGKHGYKGRHKRRKSWLGEIFDELLD